MNRPELGFDIRETEHGFDSLRPTMIRRVVVLCAAAAITLNPMFRQSSANRPSEAQSFTPEVPISRSRALRVFAGRSAHVALVQLR